ncbi:hypothetical protein QWY85_11285 [Neolewinella lacunae]|uniref:Uncharacterized protein n=1 Tax=Neolewinella lacunae TaxID=1517758 RepID=A0A923PJL0_9BACT|nr:hypothetical protein [Neolewinella lacunae]MBC6993755.1 hypothetical protein [Neolewinella lacunae]MDN3635244.1 hypothetical protein [Neolewinella lacunae]
MIYLQELANMLGDGFLPVGEGKRDQRVKRLFLYLKEAPAPTDEQAATTLGLPAGSSAYRKVKHHLKLALINGILAIDITDKSPPENRFSANDKLWNYVQGTQCSSSAARAVFLEAMREQGIENARTFDLQEPLLIGALAVAKNPPATSSRKNDYLALLDMARVELAYDYKLQVSFKHSQHLTFMNVMRESNEAKTIYLSEALKEIDAIVAVDRNRVRLTRATLGLKLSVTRGEYEEGIAISKAAIASFNQDNPIHAKSINIFKNNLVRLYLNAALHEEGLDFALETLSQMDHRDPFDYYSTKELLIVMAMRGGQYQLAYGHFLDVLQNKLGTGLASNYQETQAILEAYLYLLTRIGLVTTQAGETSLNPLRIGKFLNETETSQQEKGLRNIHVIIIKVMEHILFKRDKEFDQADAIRKYIHRHLGEPQHLRAKSFLLALIQFPENGYHKPLVMQSAEKYLQRLRDNPMGKHFEHPYTEIVGYEALWSFLMKK